MSPNRRASCAAASPRTPTTSDSPSPVRSAARSAMSSRSHSAEGIIVQCIAHVTSARGGSRPASIRSKSPAGSGKRRMERDDGRLHERHYLGLLAPPRPPTQRARKSAPRQPRKKKLAYRIFRTSRASAAGCSRMWRPNESVDEDVSNLAGIDLHSKGRRSRRRAWRDGFADQTVVQTFEDVRSYRAFERALIGRVDPRSVLELQLVHRLASLLWRLRRASAIETGLFEIQGELLFGRRQDPSRRSSQPGTPATPTRANGHSKAPGSNGSQDPPPSAQEPLSTSMRTPLEPWSKSRTIAQCFIRRPDLACSYEARLWRQAAQTIWILEAMRQPPIRQRWRPRAAPFTWERER
jgi:hypothetical protein